MSHTKQGTESRIKAHESGVRKDLVFAAIEKEGMTIYVKN
jgi:hypothetical protein